MLKVVYCNLQFVNVSTKRTLDHNFEKVVILRKGISRVNNEAENGSTRTNFKGGKLQLTVCKFSKKRTLDYNFGKASRNFKH